VTAPDAVARDQATLADILRACNLAQQFVVGLDFDAFLIDQKTQAAVLHEITVVGEAVKRLSTALRDAQPAVPWRLIAGMRDRLIHQYDAVDLEEVWKTVTTDLPKLVTDLEALLAPTGDAVDSATLPPVPGEPRSEA
jgi:uncharacterized protein with HEPN domain